MKNFYRIASLMFLFVLFISTTEAQKKSKSNAQVTAGTLLDSASLSGLKFRSLGPSLTSGRIADFAVNPVNNKEFYVASAAGGVWKTINSGNTFTPVFDNEGSFSIGCVTLDPNNPNVVWVGTGENNNQRSVDFGDGVYKSNDGGASWKNMGLKNSEHIGMIAISEGKGLPTIHEETGSATQYHPRFRAFSLFYSNVLAEHNGLLPRDSYTQIILSGCN